LSGDINRPSRPFNIHLHGEAILISGELVIGLREDNLILPGTEKDIVDLSNDFITILDKEAGPPGILGEVRDNDLETYPLALLNRIRRHPQLKDFQIPGSDSSRWRRSRLLRSWSHSDFCYTAEKKHRTKKNDSKLKQSFHLFHGFLSFFIFFRLLKNP
jgi:hypothetical protein